MNTLTDTFNRLTLKLGVSSGLFKEKVIFIFLSIRTNRDKKMKQL
jgi:hypothetical protein